MRRIYFDHNATTPAEPRVVKLVLEQAENFWGNPSSGHLDGEKAKRVIEENRAIIAKAINAKEREIVFTSGGTEANNLAIKGVAEALGKKGKHLITSSIEHESVRRVFRQLEKKGFEVSWLGVDAEGVIDPRVFEKALREDTILVSIMLANNEIGTIQPIKQLAGIAHKKGVYFHCDGVQGLGKIPIDVEELGVDLMSLSGHKVYGFKGIGALYIRRGVKFIPQIVGGHQERNRRAGTENIVGIMSFGYAVKLYLEEGKEWEKKVLWLRDKLEKGLKERFPEIKFNSRARNRLPNTVNVSFPGMDGEIILLNLDALGVSVSTGSACRAGMVEPSYVLRAIGLDEAEAKSALRISLGKDNTEEEVKQFLRVLEAVLNRIKKEN